MTRPSVAMLGLVLGSAIGIAGQTPPVFLPGGAPGQTPAGVGSGIITGRVTDPSGAPIAAAAVGITPSNAPARGGSPATPRMLTDDDGRFFFRDLSAGNYTIAATKAGWLAGAFGRGRPGGASATIDLAAAGRRSDTNIVLWRAAVIAGRVVDESGDPMVGIEMRVVPQTFVAGRRQSGTPLRVKTDDRGMYRSTDLLPGSYVVVVSANVMAEPVTMSGAVRLAGGSPRTYLQTMTAVGTAPMMFDRSEGLAGGGRSLVASLLPMAGMPPADGPWLTYATTYYPAATTTGSATVVRVAPGDERTGVDITVRYTPTFQVSGVLMGPDGPAPLHAVHLVQAESGDTPLFDVSTAVTDSSGAFTLFGVPRGQYIARVVRTPYPAGEGMRLGVAGGTGAVQYVAVYGGGPGSGPPPVSDDPLLYVSQTVTVSDRAVRDLVLTMRTGARVSGRTEFAGNVARPATTQWRGVQVLMEFAGGQSYNALFPGQFTDDGRFKTPSTLPGRYLIRVNGAPPGWSFAGTTSQGRDVSETPIDITGDLDDVVITFTDHPNKIDGRVQGGDARAIASAAVLLFPIEPATWVDYGRTTRRIRSASVSATGTFSITGQPSGDYYLIAIPDEQTADWRDPAMLAKLAPIAERIQVRDSAPLSLTLPLKRVQ